MEWCTLMPLHEQVANALLANASMNRFLQPAVTYVKLHDPVVI